MIQDPAEQAERALRAGAIPVCHPDTEAQVRLWLHRHNLDDKLELIATSPWVESGMLLVLMPAGMPDQRLWADEP